MVWVTKSASYSNNKVIITFFFFFENENEGK